MLSGRYTLLITGVLSLSWSAATQADVRDQLQPLSDDSLSAINAQAAIDHAQYLIDLADNNGPDEDAAENTFMMFLTAVLPVLDFLTSGYEIEGIEYADPDAPKSTVNDDGSISIYLPDRIEGIYFRDMKFNEDDQFTLGDLEFRNIGLTADSAVTLIPRQP